MNKYVAVIQNNLRSSSSTFLLMIVKLVVGIIFGLTFALIGQEIFAYGNFLFFFVIVSFASIFMSVARRWSSIGVGFFVLFFVMAGLLLRMYGLMAPAQ